LPQKKLEIIPSVTFNDVKAYAESWRQRLYSEVLISGNMDEGTAVSITKNIEEMIKKYSSTLRREEISSIRPVFLPLNQLSIVE
jgi:secreted Zn-dependent insulinase-like peptidase